MLHAAGDDSRLTIIAGEPSLDGGFWRHDQYAIFDEAMGFHSVAHALAGK